jgi:hypothetical protein
LGESLLDLRRCRRLSPPEKRGHQEHRQRCARSHSLRIGKRVGIVIGARVGAICQVALYLLPEAGAQSVSGKRGKHVLAVPLVVQTLVAAVVGKPPDHVFYIHHIVAAAHVRRKHQLEPGVQAVSCLEDLRGVTHVVVLVGPAPRVQREAVDTSFLGLLDLFLVRSNLQFTARVVGLVVLVGDHIVREHSSVPAVVIAVMVQISLCDCGSCVQQQRRSR